MSSPTGEDDGLERKLLTAETKFRLIQESAQKMAHKLKITERQCRQKEERLEKMRCSASAVPPSVRTALLQLPISGLSGSMHLGGGGLRPRECEEECVRAILSAEDE